MSSRRHVILGGSGFIGRHVAWALCRRGDTVLVADRDPPPPFPGRATRPAHVLIDLARSDLRELIQDGDVVHHYAWSTVPGTAQDDPMGDLDGNLRASVRLLDVMSRRCGTTLVFASSGGTVYGRLRVVPADEDHPLDPVTAYGVSKVAAEKYIGFYRARNGVDARIARISNPFGVGQDPARRQGAASIFVQRALAGESIEVWGDGSIVRDYLHVADLTAGLLAVADAAPERLGGSPVVNLGSGEGVSISRLLRILAARTRRPLRVRHTSARSFDIPVNVLDIGRARRRLSWWPRITLAEGIDRMVEEYRAGGHFYSRLPHNDDTSDAAEIGPGTVGALPSARSADPEARTACCDGKIVFAQKCSSQE
jgi:UDP-glucose 4-epimerase